MNAGEGGPDLRPVFAGDDGLWLAERLRPCLVTPEPDL